MGVPLIRSTGERFTEGSHLQRGDGLLGVQNRGGFCEIEILRFPTQSQITIAQVRWGMAQVRWDMVPVVAAVRSP